MKLTKFPRTLAAVKKGETSTWAIGDALIEECGPPSEHGVNDGSRPKLEAARQYLENNGGYEYSLSHLIGLRDTAFNFRSFERNSNLSYHVHRVAGTPEMLNAIIQGAPKGQKISGPYVEKIKKGMQLERQAAQKEADRKAQEEARKKAEKAEAREEEARRKEAEAQNKKQQAKAKEEAEKAAKEAKKARREELTAKGAPVPKAGPPKKEEVPALTAKVLVSANASRSVGLAKEAKTAILPHLDSLSSAARAGMVEAVLEAVNAWREVGELVQTEDREYEHLSVVAE